MELRPWTWRQRFILFAIYFAVLLRVVPLLVHVTLDAFGAAPWPRHGAAYPWLLFGFLFSALAVRWTEARGPALLRYAVGKL